MLHDDPPKDEFWCPTDEKRQPGPARSALVLTPEDSSALARFCNREWVSDAHLDRLQSLGLIERAFGQALLTRLGRTTVGLED